MSTSTTNWFEDSPTKTDLGNLYAEHNGPANTPHQWRYVYSDHTPAEGWHGEWKDCPDCETPVVPGEWCDDCEIQDGWHSFSCVTNWTDADIEEKEEA